MRFGKARQSSASVGRRGLEGGGASCVQCPGREATSLDTKLETPYCFESLPSPQHSLTGDAGSSKPAMPTGVVSTGTPWAMAWKFFVAMPVALSSGDTKSCAAWYSASRSEDESLPSICRFPLATHFAKVASPARCAHPLPAIRSWGVPLSRASEYEETIRGKTRRTNHATLALATGWQVPTKSIRPFTRCE